MSREEGKRGKRRPGIDGMGGGDIPCGLLYFLGSESAVLDGRRAFWGEREGGVDGVARCRRPFFIYFLGYGGIILSRPVKDRKK